MLDVYLPLLLLLIWALPPASAEIQIPTRQISRFPQFGDCNSNGVNDKLDLAVSTSLDCNTNGSPDECDVARAPRPSAVFLPTDGSVDEAYGISVALDGDVAVIGAMQEDCAAGAECGAAYVYRFDGTEWRLDARLTASDEPPHAWFGSNVAVSGNVVVIGAQTASCAAGGACGAAYVFRYDGGSWIEEANLVLPDADMLDQFGSSVAVDGEVALIGFGPGWHEREGAVQAYRYNGTKWIPEMRLDGSMSETNSVVALEDNVAVLWAFGDACAPDVKCGAAYVFRFVDNTWIEEARLVPENRVEHQGFGASASLSGDTLLISAPSEKHAAGDGYGAVYVFKHDTGTWTETERLVATDAALGDSFGFSVALDGNMAVIGSWGAIGLDCIDGRWCGAAYVFRFDGTNWVETDKLISRGFARTNDFGLSIALSRNRTLIGACSAGDVISVECGSAYLYQIPSRDCNSNGTPDECEPDFDADTLIDACDADIDDDGVPNESDVCDYTPPGAPVQPDGGLLTDADGDCDVDLVDFGIMQFEFTGPG